MDGSIITFTLNQAEQAQADKFQARHRRKHSASAGYKYKFNPTSGIGTSVHIVCVYCHKQKDITDYGAW